MYEFLELSLIPILLIRFGSTSDCQNVQTLNRYLHDVNCDQPLFVTMLPKTEENQLLDNVCVTVFPLPDDPNTFQIYSSQVYCDGSNDVTSQVALQTGSGTDVKAEPFSTVTEHVIGYAGCDTYIIYRCVNFGAVSGNSDPYVYGATHDCKPIGLSCLRKIEEIIQDQGLPEQDFYLLPMKLPNRCVTQQLCVQPPNPFYNKLPYLSLL